MSHHRVYAEATRRAEGGTMAQNRVQFQPGMSMPEFLAQYRTEAQCEAALERVR